MKIAVDMMGSDLGPVELSSGVKTFLDKKQDVNLVLFGDASKLEDFKDNPRVEIVNTTEIVPMEVSPLEFLRMKDSSMIQALKRANMDQEIEGVVSAGSTGGFVTGATLILKNIPGVPRAGLTGPFLNFCSAFGSSLFVSG